MNETDATAIFAPLWRRKWLILAVGVLVAAGSYFYYRHKTPLFQQSTQIYLGGGAEEGAGGEKVSRESSQSVANQVAVLNSIVIPSVHRELRLAGNRPAARGTAKAVSAEGKSEFITITAQAHTQKATASLANAVAVAYLRRERAARRRGILSRIEIARRQLRRIELTSAATPSKGSGSASKAAGSSTSTVLQEAGLSTKINGLEAELAVPGAQQVNPARPAGATQLSPKPRQNAIFGFVIGLALACIFAYILGRFDRRLRTLASIDSVFGVPMLVALPTVRRPVVVRDGARAASKQLLEPLRTLHAVLKLRPSGVAAAMSAGGNGGTAASAPRRRVFLVTSADVGDGKSTLIADLALVMRDAGERVAVVDANLRRPAMATLLGVEQGQGLAEVLLGDVDVHAAMQGASPIGEAPPPGGQSASTAQTVAAPRRVGELAVLASGEAVHSQPVLLGADSMQPLLATLANEFDFVLVDGPSPLEVSDAMPLLSLVDGVVVVARMAHTREQFAARLAQLLHEERVAPTIGVVANCVAPKQIERYGLASSNAAGWARKLARR